MAVEQRGRRQSGVEKKRGRNNEKEEREGGVSRRGE